MAAESKLKPLSIPRNRENDGWLVCPKCGSGYATPTHFCKKCRYYAPSWTPSDVKKAYEIIVGNKLDLSMLISGEYLLDNIDKAFALLEQGVGIKYAVRPYKI